MLFMTITMVFLPHVSGTYADTSGLNNISVLNRSWRGCLAEGGRVSTLLTRPEAQSDVLTEPDNFHMVGLNELLSLYDDPKIQLWYTRRVGEFNGDERL